MCSLHTCDSRARYGESPSIRTCYSSYEPVGEISANRGVVSIQGGSSQAAQYVGKMLTAEVWAAAEPRISVSANTAGVSLTGSLQHPVFEIAFAGARALDVETFAPATTAALN